VTARAAAGEVGRLARKAIWYELRLWRSLFRWILRRPTAEPGAATFGYAALLTPVLVAFIVVSAIEIPIVHLVLPWATVRTTALAAGVYGLLWMIGLLAAMRVHPHVVGDAGLRVRSGMSVDLSVPWSAVAELRIRSRTLESNRAVQQHDGVLSVVAWRHTNVEVTLREPTVFPLPGGPSDLVREVRFHADDEKALLSAARERLAAFRDRAAATGDGATASAPGHPPRTGT
jgi:hypothetical protein